jgi:succinate-semialdehyde dehydrogenase/glutarate-semialdehyde dehydrogenase
MTITPINPTTGLPIRDYAAMDATAARKTIAAADRAYHDWRRTSFDERASLMRGAARELRERTPEFAGLMAVEMGKPVKSGAGEIEKCAWVCEYFADSAASMLADETIATEATRSYVSFQPLGVILAVMPWNFPFWQVFRFAAPALMAGNVAVLKHASNVPGCALAIEDVFRRAGFPPEVFRTLLIDSKSVKNVIRNPLVRAVTLTGSTDAGREVAAVAGKALKKCVLELGGSDPYLILEDADLEVAAKTCAASRLINSGQSCIAAKRFIVVEPLREAFERLLVGHMREARMGNPMSEDTEFGPLARGDLRDNLHDQVNRSIAKGARLLLGGLLPEGDGAFYPPTVLTDVKKGMPAFDDELFGPVAAIIPVKNERAAIRAANDSVYGLGAAVFTRDVARGEQIAATELEAGFCIVNDSVKSDQRLPFGGIKASGFGRELSHYGIKEFVNIKTLVVR